MGFVPRKTEEQLDLQALHRVRERWVMRRTAVVNQIRSLLLERGLTLPKGRSHLDEQLPRILEDAELRDPQGDACKRQQSDFGHRASCLGSKQQIPATDY